MYLVFDTNSANLEVQLEDILSDYFPVERRIQKEKNESPGLFPERFPSRVLAGNPPEHYALPDVPRTDVKAMKERAKFACAVQPRYWLSVDIKDLRAGISSGASLGIQNAREQTHCIERGTHKGTESLQIPIEIRIIPTHTEHVVAGDGVLQDIRPHVELLSQEIDSLTLRNPPSLELRLIIVAPLVNVSDFPPKRSRYRASTKGVGVKERKTGNPRIATCCNIPMKDLGPHEVRIHPCLVHEPFSVLIYVDVSRQGHFVGDWVIVIRDFIAKSSNYGAHVP